MIVGENSRAGASVRLVSPSASSASMGSAHRGSVSRGDIEANPTYFRSISSISYGSLAGAYQSFRSLDSEAAPAARQSAPAAILSGAGIPAALQAYSEAMESADI